MAFVYGKIALLIHKKKFRHAISIIHKEKLQSNIADIMNYYNEWDFSDDSIYDFLLEYIEHGQLSYKIDKTKQHEGHVLTDIQKELDKNTYPRRNELSDRIMHLFVLRLLKPGRRKLADDLELFSFCTIKKHNIEQLQKEVIQVTNPDKFNDPFDCLILSEIRRHKEMLKTENRDSVNTYVKEMSRIRVRCFAGWDKKKEKPPYLNTLMWSHYAKDHEGICIKYSISANEPILGKGVSNYHSSHILDKVIYTKEAIPNKNILNYKECFLIKDKAWRYENEFRLISYDYQEEGDFITIPLSTLGLKIKAVYFGLNCSPCDRKEVETALEGKGVKFYTLGYDKEYMNRVEIIDE